ncbi:hypothetical protein OQA88_6282 [Cercophora sp. LCS_1]
MPGHGHRVYIDVPIPRSITPPLVFRPRSPRTPPRSPHHYRRHSLSLEEPRPFVIREEMYQEREDNLRAAKESLLRHNIALKAQLQSKEQKIRDQQSIIDQLDRENHELRRSLDSSSDADSRRETKIRDLKKKAARLEADNETLKTRIRDAIRLAKEATDDRVRLLKDELSTLSKQVGEWRRRYDDADRRLKRLRENMDDHIDANRKLTSENARLQGEIEALRRDIDGDGLVRRRYR